MNSDKKLKCRVGDIVECHFLDHSMGDGDIEPVEAILHGKIQKIDRKHIVICAWDSPKEHEENWESFAVIKSCIEKLIVWTEGDVRYISKDSFEVFAS